VPAADEIAAVALRLDAADPAQILEWALGRFGDRFALTTSFQVEGLVILDLARRLAPEVTVLAIDTGRLPEETYAVAEAYRRRGARIRWLFPRAEAVEALENEHGPYSFRRGLDERRACCHVRKVEPMARALEGFAAYGTGRRRDQSATRASLPVVELDAARPGLVKVNPLAAWSDARVWAYVREHALPYSALYDRGYRSVGCAPCTRAVQPGEHARAGRWWWESPEHSECGLHLVGLGGGI
jgi:phosphoadenosine phosphosulfate reductase